jgi:hypothetical protein
MATIELDMQDSDGVIVSVAQADDAAWAQIATQAQAAAVAAGYTLTDVGPLVNSPERTITNLGSVQAWIATLDNVGSTAMATPGASGGGVSPGIIAGVAVAGVLAIIALAMATRKRR